ncbi:hypothetical protein R2083_12660 [Nitrosomonas sp. Is35]|jgi:hypothetical protein|uniref:hypothetical protein n=1 Tax=unclassified Nitrosomonas TaxID=2609265 RepID=UPI00294B49D5|nr:MULTISPECIES: hypothetical protein [unclassified Nitrosomonas]MDV6342465.1 hypothetical protein [Nitrosomonas sp. Is24]MDV6348369.1 hypothetical protein [Nitrosomonas sp. Is35]
MPDNNTLKDKNNDVSNQQLKKINIRIKQMDNSIQPIYSNVTSALGSKEIVMLDFGYLDIQLIASLNRMLASGENIPNIIDAKMTCRVALNFDAVSQLIKQLNNILEPQQVIKSGEPIVEQTAPVPEKELGSSVEVGERLDQDPAKPSHSGFKFPWSK